MRSLRDWIPALGGMACLGFGAGLMSIYGFFVEPLSREFDVGVATLNIGPVALLLVPGLVAPFVGRMADRVPVRRLLLTGSAIAMLALFAASRAPNLALAGLAYLVFALGLTLYGPVVVNSLMVRLYPLREARALAIVAMGISLSSALLPPVVGLLLAALDWRAALGALSLALLAILWLLILASIPGDAGVGSVGGTTERLQGLWRRREFWLIGLCVALGFNVSIVLAICYPPHFMAEGFSVAQAGGFLSVAGLAGLAGKTVIAWLGDAGRAYARWMVVGLLGLQALGLVMLLSAESAVGVVAALIPLGLGGGAFIPMHPYLNSQYYEPEVIGQVNGAQMPLFLPFGLVGPPLAGYLFDLQGNYHAVLAGLVAVLSLAALMAALLPSGAARAAN